MIILSLVLGLLTSVSGVQAQEQASTVAVNIEVLLAVQGNQPIAQDQISYDILQYNSTSGMNEIVYSYASTNPPAEALNLPEGSYIFRLYDGGNFERDGSELLPFKAEMTALNSEQPQELTTLDSSGDVVLWEDGKRVYDLAFEVTASESLLNPSTNQYETDLVLTIADEASLASLASNPEDPQEAEQEGEGVGQLNLQVVTEDNTIVEGAIIAVNGSEYHTDAQGDIRIDNLPVGLAEIVIISLPEGFTVETAYVENAEIVANSTNNATLIVQSLPEEAATNSVTIAFSHEGVPVSDISVRIQDYEVYSDINGEAIFNELPVGDLGYTINSVPQGYTIDNLTGVVTVSAEAASRIPIEVNQAASSSVLFTVVNEANEPITAVEIQLNEIIMATNELGQVTFDNLLAGGHSYQVISVPDNYQLPAGSSVNVDPETITEQTITLVADQQFGSALISILDEASNPVIGAEIILNDSESFVTNEQGQIHIDNLVAESDNEYYISALPEGYELEVEPELRHFTVIADQQVEDTLQVNLASQYGGVKLVVRDEIANPIEGAVVAIGDQTLTTDASGQLVLEQLEVGEYTYNIQSLEGQYEGALGGSIIVEANQKTEQVIDLTAIEQLGSVTFKLVDQNNEAIEAGEIEIVDQVLVTDGTGQVTVEGLTVGQSYNYTLQSLPDNYSGQASGVVTPLADSGTVEIITVERSIPLGQLTITVVDQNDEPVNGAELQLNETTTATTNAEGQVVFSDLSEATYNYVIQSLPDNYENITNSQSVYIAEGASESRQFQVRRNIQKGTVIFNIKDQDDQAVEGVVVSFVDKTFETNADGTATASDIEPADYSYSITKLPEGYKGEMSAQVTVTEGETTTVELYIEREVELSQATFTIIDQNKEAVEGVTLAFGGLTGVSNEEGRIYFESIEPGRYHYGVSDLPSAYENTFEDSTLDVEEGSEYDEQIVVEKLPATGSARIHITANNQALKAVTVTLNGKEVITDKEGYASFEKLQVGSYSFVISKLPQGYELGTSEGTVEIKAEEVSTVEIQAMVIEDSTSSSESSSSQDEESVASEESSSIQESSSEASSSESSSSSVSQPTPSINIDETHSLTPQEQASIDEEAAQATRQFVDNETGIEVWVNPQDANNIDRLLVEKLTSSAALENAEADIYQLTLLDRQNNAVQLTKIAEVKIPTRPVTSQLRIVRLNNESLSNLTFALHNQRVTFRTQQLGGFAVVYNTAQDSITEQSESNSVSVTVESSVEEGLPKTGERSSRSIMIMLAIALLSLAYLLFTYNNRRKDV